MRCDAMQCNLKHDEWLSNLQSQVFMFKTLDKEKNSNVYMEYQSEVEGIITRILIILKNSTILSTCCNSLALFYVYGSFKEY